MTHRIRIGFLFSAICILSLAGKSTASDWLHWRGPQQTGYSTETGLPDYWDPNTPGKGNLVWKQPYGCRTTPLIMNGKLYITGPFGDNPGVPGPKEKLLTGERVACFDAATGKLIWEKHFNVFHTDIVTNRLGWQPLAADPANKLIFVHLTGGLLMRIPRGYWRHRLEALADGRVRPCVAATAAASAAGRCTIPAWSSSAWSTRLGASTLPAQIAGWRSTRNRATSSGGRRPAATQGNVLLESRGRRNQWPATR